MYSSIEYTYIHTLLYSTLGSIKRGKGQDRTGQDRTGQDKPLEKEGGGV